MTRNRLHHDLIRAEKQGNELKEACQQALKMEDQVDHLSDQLKSHVPREKYQNITAELQEVQSTPLNRVTSVRAYFDPIKRRTLLTENIFLLASMCESYSGPAKSDPIKRLTRLNSDPIKWSRLYCNFFGTFTLIHLYYLNSCGSQYVYA